MRLSLVGTVGLVALLIVSMFLVVPGTVRGAAPTHHVAVVRPAATDLIWSTDSFGGISSSFENNIGNGRVYFSAYDPSDTTATVHVNDLNASRDGVSNPVWSVTVKINATTNYNNSWTWNGYYQIPESLVYGGLWNVTISGSAGGFSHWNFFVHTYSVGITTDKLAYLAGQTGQFVYFVFSDANEAPYAHVTSVKIFAEYQNNLSVYLNLPGFPATETNLVSSWVPFTVPKNASTYGWITFQVWANTTGTNVNVSESSFGLDAGLGSVTGITDSLSACPTACSSSVFAAGSPIYVTVNVTMTSPRGIMPAVGVSVGFKFYSGPSAVTSVPGNPPTTVTTNPLGGAQVVFLGSAPAFSLTQPNGVSVEAWNPLGSTTTMPVWDNLTFNIFSGNVGRPYVQVVLNAATYYAGDTVFVNWSVTQNQSASGGWNGSYYEAIEGNFGTILGIAPLSGSSGAFSYALPLGYVGFTEVIVIVSNATSTWDGFARAPVSHPQMTLTPSEGYFNPGDTVTVAISTAGSAFTGATLYATSTDSMGNVLQSGAVTGNSVSYTVPKAASQINDVLTSVVAEGSGGVVATASVYVYEASGLDVFAGISTASSYVDGSFQPGQTVTVTYNIVSRANAPLPKQFDLTFWPTQAWYGSGLGEWQETTTQASGSFSYTIPSNTPNGEQPFWLEVSGPSGCSNCFTETQFSINVEKNPSVLGMMIGAGSGLTVGWLILLIIVIVVAVILVLMIRRRGGRTVMMKPESSQGSTAAPAQTWQESPPSGAGDTSASSPPPGAGGQ